MDHSVPRSFQPSGWSGGSSGPFLLRGRRQVHAPSLGARLTPGPVTSLAERAARAFAEAAAADAPEAPGQTSPDPKAPAGPQAGREAPPPMLVGAIPYDRRAEDALFRPLAVFDSLPATRAPAPARTWSVSAQPAVEGYKQAVLAALERFGPDLQKVVLSRSLTLLGTQKVDLGALLGALAGDPAVAAFVTPLPALDGAPRHMVGATPELLVSRRGREVLSNPLAGSLPRAGHEAEADAAGVLMGQDKDRREHQLVVEAVADALAPFCARLSVPSVPSLQGTRSMWHLGTRIAGTLREDVPVAELLAALHPTPAVCGTPRDAADALLRELEGYDRGFYAGAVGWLDAAGDGDWYITLRCAEVSGQALRLFAGAGIVPGSDPDTEAAETSAKFLAMLRALGVDEGGQPLDVAQPSSSEPKP